MNRLKEELRDQELSKPKGQERDYIMTSTTTSSTESNQASTSTKLSEEAKQNLSGSTQHNYIKFKQGQDYKVLNIDPEHTHTEYVQYKENEKPTLQ